jgi:hypothetical protein
VRVNAKQVRAIWPEIRSATLRKWVERGHINRYDRDLYEMDELVRHLASRPRQEGEIESAA